MGETWLEIIGWLALVLACVACISAINSAFEDEQ